jgi:FimV-like protein
MSRGQKPLIWMMAASLPSAGHALGLGEIHVDSALNEPLAAEIDIVGATPDDLIGLRASVANRDTFARFGADRPAFLNTATFKVTLDAKGRPVLAIRSSESFTEPLVNFVVDLRWHNGELIRQYTLLLDPAGFPAAARVAEALPVPSSQASRPAPVVTITTNATAATGAAPAPVAAAVEVATPSPAASPRKTSQIKVGARATLRGVAWRVGARSESDLKRLMLAIFRANPSAFDGNINRLHLGALLTIPSAEAVALIPKSEANREIHAQMVAWRAARPASAATPAVASAAIPAAATPVIATPAATSAAATPKASALAVTTPATAASATTVPVTAAPAAIDAENVALAARVKSLESSLHELQTELEAQHNKMLNLQAQATYADQHPTVTAAAPQPVPVHSGRGWLAGGVAGIALLAGLCAALLRRWRKRAILQPRFPHPVVAAIPGADPVAQAPVASAIQVSEHAPSHREARAELHQMEHEARGAEAADADAPSAEASDAHAPMASLDAIHRADSADTDTAELDVDAALRAARTREEELHTERVRQELALAWSIPAAEEYGRFDDTVTTLAEALAKSMADTVKLRTPGEAQSADETLVTPSDTALLPASTVNMRADAADADTASTMPMPSVTPPAPSARMETTKLDYNLVDLDQTGQHVHMPSVLEEDAVVKERRKNLVDVLKNAIEREPDRSDLRMKLLETYYSAAASNRQGFLDVVKELASDRNNLPASQWEKVEFMARQIAADAAMSEGGSSEDTDLADCA